MSCRIDSRLWTLVVLIFTAASRADSPASDPVSLVPEEYRHQLVQRLSLAEGNREKWLGVIQHSKPDQREAIAFLLVNMPERDLKSLDADMLLHDVELAYDARAKTPWAGAVPKDIFLNDVLPYANLNERRDDWRADFVKRFTPLVKDCKSTGEAAQLLNREAFKVMNVKYHATKRPKPDQSPYESTEAGYASCSGLSILLVDACRAVGVPARVVGTPLWSNGSGNHTWVEIWDGQWRFIGAAEPGPFNQTWFADSAAKADLPDHGVYAASFRQTGKSFPLVWDPKSTDYPAEDVTSFYAGRNYLNVKPAAVTVKPSDLDGDWVKLKRITPRGYVAARATPPINIDGKGDEPAWAAAAWTEDFVDIEGAARPTPRFRTHAKLLWDDDNLYIFAELQEPHVWGTITKQNAVIFADNDFEVFIDPDGDHHNYYECEMNPLNTIWELTLEKPYRDGGKAKSPTNIEGLRHAVHVDGTLNDPSNTDQSWSVEIAIPWKGLAPYAGPNQACPPKDGQQWRMNFSRVEWLVDIIDGKYRKIPKEMRPEDNWVWSPQGVVEMHRPERWGFVQFSSSPQTAKYQPDPTFAAREALMTVYYRQKEFHKRNGRYATSAAEIGMAPEGACALNPVEITATPDGFTASTPALGAGTKGKTLHVRQDSKLWQE